MSERANKLLVRFATHVRQAIVQAHEDLAREGVCIGEAQRCLSEAIIYEMGLNAEWFNANIGTALPVLHEALDAKYPQVIAAIREYRAQHGAPASGKAVLQ